MVMRSFVNLLDLDIDQLLGTTTTNVKRSWKERFVVWVVFCKSAASAFGGCEMGLLLLVVLKRGEQEKVVVY